MNPLAWTLFKDPQGEPIALGIVDDHLLAYRVATPTGWRLACDVPLKPPAPQDDAPPEVREAFDAVEALLGATLTVSGEEGEDCGTAHYQARHNDAMASALRQAIYRPWSLQCRYDPSGRGGDSTIDDPRTAQHLPRWALTGIEEFHSFARYQARFERATDALAGYYRKQFGWSEGQADGIAQTAVTASISRGFAFSSRGYQPFSGGPEEALRRAILEHRTMAEIRAIPFDMTPLEQKRAVDTDSILAIAIDYPEALGYLLERGADPNARNAFDKTPLMYAVQRNQPEAVRRLLAAGADPNARTGAPVDRCQYPIHTLHMTALHYGARYASADILRQLLAAGAATYLQSHHPERGAEYPQDWLRRHVAVGSGEPNPYIPVEQADEVAGLLHVPDEGERRRQAAGLVTQGEAAYAKGDVEAAYRLLQRAVAAQPDHPKALSDLPLVALRSGRLGTAIETAGQAVATLREPRLLAAAWFNKGLVCETKGAFGYRVDGQGCDWPEIEPFFRAVQLQANPARVAKLRSVLQTAGPESCIVPGGAAGRFVRIERRYDAGQKPIVRLYLLHPAGEVIEPERVHWGGGALPPSQTATPTSVQRVTLGDDAVTLFQGEGRGYDVVIDGHPCKEQ